MTDKEIIEKLKELEDMTWTTSVSNIQRVVGKITIYIYFIERQ